MKNIDPKNKGFAPFVVIAAVVVIGIAVAGVAFLSKGSIGLTNTPESSNLDLNFASSPMPTVSSSTDIDVIEKEFSATTIESVDSEFTSLSASASAL